MQVVASARLLTCHLGLPTLLTSRPDCAAGRTQFLRDLLGQPKAAPRTANMRESHDGV
jgi:hypothetical protein